jgi:hypothetical protein
MVQISVMMLDEMMWMGSIPSGDTSRYRHRTSASAATCSWSGVAKVRKKSSFAREGRGRNGNEVEFTVKKMFRVCMSYLIKMKIISQ